jgi:hypothetical protein
MEKSPKKISYKTVGVPFKQSEYDRLKKLYAQSTERALSTYVRKVALQKPVTVKYRNASADDFLRDMLELKKQLSALGSNYCQAVKKLQLLEKIPEFRTWLLAYESSRQAFLSKVSEIHLKIIQLYEQWLQK